MEGTPCRPKSCQRVCKPKLVPELTICEIPKRVQEIQAGRYGNQFQLEFENVNVSFDGTFERGRQACHLNLCPEYMPYDCNRVVLKPRFISECDYINASPITWDNKRFYIATQSVDEYTVDSFWRMVWQEKVNIIITITQKSEKALWKYGIYWPKLHKSKKYADNITVRTICKEDKADYKKRLFKICFEQKDCQKEEKVLYHYHFQKWPPNRIPCDPYSVLRLLHDVNDVRSTIEACCGCVGPILVQSYCGVGRTGTLIAIHMAMDYIKTNGLNCTINPQEIVKMLRAQRVGLVRSLPEYFYLFRVLALYVEELKDECCELQPQETCASCPTFPLPSPKKSCCKQAEDHNNFFAFLAKKKC